MAKEKQSKNTQITTWKKWNLSQTMDNSPYGKRVKDMKRVFSQNETQISLKHMKRYPDGVALRETNSNSSGTKFAST